MTQDRNEKTFLPNSKTCFICGEDNAAGLRTRFFVQDGLVKSIIEPQPHHCGYANVVHGGIVAAVVDETMGWAAARAIERMCFTAEMNIRYIKPVPADRPMTVCADVEKASRRLVYARGWIIDDTGEEFARATGRFMPLSAEETLVVDSYLIYRGSEERVFEKLKDASQD